MTQNAKKVLIKDQVLKIRTLLETVLSARDPWKLLPNFFFSFTSSSWTVKEIFS